MSITDSGEQFQSGSLPTIIQGGMGIAVSSWRLARRVAELGEFGVVSGTGIDTVVVRELQDGDPHGRIQALRAFPDGDIVDHLIKRFYVASGRAEGTPYELLPMHKFKPTIRSQRILAAAAFSEVYLAKRGHDGMVGINVLAKMKRYTLPCLYGAMLAGVDAVLMGAGIPIEEAEQLALLAEGKAARLRLDVDTSRASDPKAATADGFFYDFDPANVVSPAPRLNRPRFFPIISSDTLARVLDKKVSPGLIAGWIIEGPIAGGHNAPPRGKQSDESGNPVYDERDVANLDRVAALGYPFYLAGGFGTPDRVKEALRLGANGVQVGSLFALSQESGYPVETTRQLVRLIHEGKASVRTDARMSSTGFPFKVLEVEDTLGVAAEYEQRTRICDLGYLQQAYLDENDRIQVRCPAEPVDTYVRKGGDIEDTVGRGCLCNGLMANIGLPQTQKTGEELPLFTAGDEIIDLPLGSAESPDFSAADVVRYLMEDVPA